MLIELKLAKEVAQGAVNLIRTNFLHNVGITSAIGKDIKTKADIAAHEFIINKLAPTGIQILSEEAKNERFELNSCQWIVDPIDGTMNLARGFNMAAVSIALWDGGVPILGVIQHIYYDQIFSSAHNSGAWLNDSKIVVSNIENRDQAILATGFPSASNFSKQYLDKFVKDAQNYKKIRMLGSASLMLAYVACGYFDVYQENDIYIWDVAAGLALISESNGYYKLEKGSTDFQFKVTASNMLLK